MTRLKMGKIKHPIMYSLIDTPYMGTTTQAMGPFPLAFCIPEKIMHVTGLLLLHPIGGTQLFLPTCFYTD